MTERNRLASAKRIVVKVGSSSLTTPDGALDESRLNRLVQALADRSASSEVILVSSGAIAAGLAPLGLKRRPADLASQQAAASVGQGRLMAHYASAFAERGLTVGQVLLTAEDVTRRSHYLNASRTLTKLVELGIIPVVNENDTVATGEIRFGDNDRLASLVALLVQADALILLSDVDGLYDGPPGEGANLISEVRGPADLQEVNIGGVGSSVGTGGMATKVEAAQIASAAGIPVLLTSADLVAAALGDNPPGTFFYPQARLRGARSLWLEHATASRGAMILDEGAVKAIVQSGSSLLAAGVSAVEGEFAAGDAVDLLNNEGQAIARGLVAFDSTEIPKMLGKSMTQLGVELGPDYARELIHRDDLVVLNR